MLVPYGKLDAAALRQAYEQNPKQRLQIQLRRHARPGQPEALDQIPVYAHVRVRRDLGNGSLNSEACSAVKRSAQFDHRAQHPESGVGTHQGVVKAGLTGGDFSGCMSIVQLCTDNKEAADAPAPALCRKPSTTLGSGMHWRLCT